MKSHFSIYFIYRLIHSIFYPQVARRRIRNKPGIGSSSVAPAKDKVSRTVSNKSTVSKKNNPQLTIDTSGTMDIDANDGNVTVSTIGRLKRTLFSKRKSDQVTVSTDIGSKSLNVPRSPPGIKVQRPSTDMVSKSPSGQLSPSLHQLSPTDGKFDSLETTDDQLNVPGASNDVQIGSAESDKISIVSSESRNDLSKENAGGGTNGHKDRMRNKGSGKIVSKNGGAPMVKVKSKSDMAKEKERKTARILGIITGCFLMCWLPFFGVTTYNTLCSDDWEITNPVVLSVLLWLGYCNSMLNPIIYTIFSPDFRSAFKKMVECKRNPGYG